MAHRVVVTNNDDSNDGRRLEIRWPWWLHPAWTLLFFVGGTAIAAASIPASDYSAWKVPKYLDVDMSFLLILGLLLIFSGITIANFGNARGGRVHLFVSDASIQYMRRLYKLFMLLSILGYAFWTIIAVVEGVRIADVISVFQRDMGAISNLKASSRPIAGITTLTQFGPVAVAIGVILKKLGTGSRSYWWLVGLAAARSVLYAERLALLEVLMPMILISALTARDHGGRRLLTQALPLILGPAVWAVFAIFEYTRSWVYYQNVVAVPFTEWVTSRLLGYYVTAYNNSALFYISHEGIYGLPYMSVPAFWNAPGSTLILSKPDWHGMSPENWWHVLLATKGNPEFTSIGSFLVTFAEMGWGVASLFWLVVGLFLGGLFAGMSRGHLPALLSYSVLFIGLLEIPRLIYWTEGRTFPILLALLAIWLWWPRSNSANHGRGLARRTPPGRSAHTEEFDAVN